MDGHVQGDIIGLVMAMIMDAYTRRLLQLGERLLGPAPCDFVWMAAGSQARNEVHMLSINNTLIADNANDIDRSYFHHLAMLCLTVWPVAGMHCVPGRFMAASPKWCQPLQAPERVLRKSITNPRRCMTACLMPASFLSCVPLYGQGEELLWR